MRANSSPVVLALAFLLSTSAVHASSGDTVPAWSRFRGPAGAGVAAAGVAFPDALDPGANLRWRAAVPPGHSSPCVFGDRLFVTGAEGELLVTTCLDRSTGRVLWRRSVEATGDPLRLHDVNSPASPTPATDGEHVISYFGTFGLVAYDIDGNEAWRRELEIPRNTFGVAASPVIAGDVLVFASDANEGSFLEAIVPATGETVWRVDRDGFGSGWSTPAVRPGVDGRDELLLLGVWWLVAYDLETGAKRWSVPGLTDEPIVTPVGGDGLVFVTSYNMNKSPEVIGLPPFAELLEQCDADGSGDLDQDEARANDSILSRFDADGDGDHPLRIFFGFLDRDRDGLLTEAEYGKIFEWLGGFEHANALVAIRPPGADSAGGDAGAEIAWQYTRGVPECPSPLYLDGLVYLVKNGGMITCLDAASGELVYQERLDSGGPCYASPVAGDGKIYSASSRGVMTVIRAGRELEVLSQTDLGEKISATPALVDGTVYVRTDASVLAFE